MALAPTSTAFPRKRLVNNFTSRFRDHLTQVSRVIELVRSCRVEYHPADGGPVHGRVSWNDDALGSWRCRSLMVSSTRSL